MLSKQGPDLDVWTDHCEPIAPYQEAKLVLNDLDSGGKTTNHTDMSETTATVVIIHSLVISTV